ncbi:MAG: zinc ribbon domain-containing protein [Prevotella sp.]|nr:zinc ribbon domain-containing protein [Prevotella sp.]
MIIKCPECGHQVSDRARTCPSCGVDIAGKVTRCPDCGEYIFKDDHECPNCHCSINAAAAEPETALPDNLNNPNSQIIPSIPTISADTTQEPPKKKSRKAFWSALIVGLVLALIIVFLGIYYAQKTQMENELRAYENAMMSTEPAVLQNFLDMYIEAPVAHRDSIKVHLQTLMKIDRDWENARISKSKSALQLFIDRNSDNVHVREARLMIDSLDFETAKMGNSMESYKKYMEDHEQGYYYDEAKSEYDRLEEEMVRAAQIKAEQDSIKAAEEAAVAAEHEATILIP